MGQSPSRRVSSSSTHSLLATSVRTVSTGYSTAPTSPTSPTSPIELKTGITTPAPPRQIIRLSEIIDPRDILQAEAEAKLEETPKRPRRASQPLFTPRVSSRGIVQSPSGNTLGAEEFIAHPDRPLAIWERQERVVEATRKELERYEAESRAGMMSSMSNRSEKKTLRRCCMWS